MVAQRRGRPSTPTFPAGGVVGAWTRNNKGRVKAYRNPVTATYQRSCDGIWIWTSHEGMFYLSNYRIISTCASNGAALGPSIYYISGATVSSPPPVPPPRARMSNRISTN